MLFPPGHPIVLLRPYHVLQVLAVTVGLLVLTACLMGAG